MIFINFTMFTNMKYNKMIIFLFFSQRVKEKNVFRWDKKYILFIKHLYYWIIKISKNNIKVR